MSGRGGEKGTLRSRPQESLSRVPCSQVNRGSDWIRVGLKSTDLYLYKGKEREIRYRETGGTCRDEGHVTMEAEIRVM